jgi:cytochrome oxidase Cu insertion factor (SCO1/SenC/PrrC family)
MKQRLFAITLALLCSLPALAQRPPYPQPQIADAEQRLMPDFNLRDQSGKAFKLSAMRGTPVLIYFYRGYW